MNLRIFLSILLMSTLLHSCKKEADPCNDLVCLNGGACQDGNCICPEGFGGVNCQTVLSTTGTALFWTTEPLDYGDIDVTMNGITKTITASTGSSYPDCNYPNYNPTFELPQGEHSYEAHDSYRNWNGTVDISYAGQCGSTRLTVQNPDYSTVTVYTKNSQYLPVTVTLTGAGVITGSQTLTITQAFPNGITSCNVQGCANFLVFPGQTNMTASGAAGNFNPLQFNVTTSCYTIVLN